MDWLSIGGGIHCVHLAARWVGEAGVALERLRIVDPTDRLLDRWRTCTASGAAPSRRRPADEISELEERLLALVCARPGESMTAFSEELGQSVPSLQRPAKAGR